MSTFSMRICTATLFPCFLLVASLATADEPAADTSTTERPMFYHDRPESVRGWVTVAKAAYWSLAYESLDRMQEARELIGKGKDSELADAFDKCGCWLDMAASAAMTDGRSGILGASARFEAAALAIRDGSASMSDAQLNDLVTLGLVCMAKSHVLRADSADESFREERTSAIVSKEKTPFVQESTKEILAAKMEADIDQYEYDAIQSRRHLQVAQVYLEAAAKDGGFQLDEEFTAKIPELAKDLKPFELVDYVDSELRPKIKSFLNLIAAHRTELIKRLPE